MTRYIYVASIQLNGNEFYNEGPYGTNTLGFYKTFAEAQYAIVDYLKANYDDWDTLESCQNEDKWFASGSKGIISAKVERI